MKCPYCGAEESKVIDSRPTEDSERIRRRRECLNCHMRFTTYEVVETVPLIVIRVPTVHVLHQAVYSKEKECLDIWVA